MTYWKIINFVILLCVAVSKGDDTKGLVPIEQCPWHFNNLYDSNVTHPKDFRWLARIGVDDDFFCSGTLINNQYVLVAAHNIYGKDASSLIVRLGEWDTTSDPDCFSDNNCAPSVVDIQVESTIIHESYKEADFTRDYNDIALLKLRKFVEYSDWIKPACLPRTSLLKEYSIKNKKMVSVGFGMTKSDNLTRYMKQGLFFETKPYPNLCYGKLMCAFATAGHDNCQGDGGSPLMVRYEKNYLLLVGISSFGEGCGTKPGMYTNIQFYIDWIEKNI